MAGHDPDIYRCWVTPSPLVGEGGEIERSEMKPGEGFVSADGDPSSGADFIRATFSHKGRRKTDHVFRASNAIRTARPASTVPIR